MNPRSIQTYTRRFPLQIINAFGLAIILLPLESIAASPAQQPKQYVFLFASVVKEQQGKCPGNDVEFFIDDVSYGAGGSEAKVPLGSHKVTVKVLKKDIGFVIIKSVEIWEEDYGGIRNLTFNDPEVTFSITPQTSRLYVYWACQGAPAKEESFNLAIGWRDEEWQIFGSPVPIVLHCCLPKEVQVFAYDAKNNPVSGAQTQLYFDDVLVATRDTGQNGRITFELNLPDSLPKGRSQHILKAQAQKNNGPPVVKIAAVEIARDVSSITVALDPISGGEFFPGDSVRISGRVWSLQNGLFMDPVKANITVHEEGSGSAITADENTFRASTDDGGFFQMSAIVSTTVDLRAFSPVQAQARLRERLFDLTAVPVDQNQYDDVGRTNFRVWAKTKGQLVVTTITDKVVYDQGDSAVVSGNVSTDGKPMAGNVNIYLRTNGSKAQTASNSSGQFSLAMPIGPAASSQPGVIIPAITPGTYYAAVQAEAKGYTASPITNAYFLVQELNPLCRAGRIAVASLVGSPSARTSFTADRIASDSVALRSGGALVQGLDVQTSGSDKVTLAFDLGNGASATVALNGATQVEIGRYCQDASGKVTLALKLAHPGQVAVNVNNPTGASPNFQIITRTASITSVHTRYVVTADRAGATHVAAFDGVVRVADPNGANSIDVGAGKLISVQTNQAPNKARVLPISGRLDPALDSLLANAPPPRGSAFPPLVSAGSSTSATAPSPAVIDLTGLWLDNTGGGAVYRLRQVGNKVYWSVNAGAGGSINMYTGEISGNTINGVWVDLPQSSTYNTGQLNLRIDTKDHLIKVGENPCCYGAQEWRRQGTTASVGPPPSGGAPPGIPSAGGPGGGPGILPGSALGGPGPSGSAGPAPVPSPPTTDLTGLWLDNGGRAVYRLRQVGNKVYWSVNAGSGGSINMYTGEISGNTINGVWVDLPQSSTYNTGQLNLRIDTKDHLIKVGENPCCYGAQEWRRQGTTAAAPPPSHAAPPPSGAAPPPGVGGGTGAPGGAGPGPTGPAIDWTTETAVRLNLRGKNGQHFSYTCPPKGNTTGIWGTDIYTDDSLICVAAVHAGLITFQNGGPVTIEILPGQASYTGSARNGVTSSPYGAYAGSYKFVRDIVGLPQQVLPRDAGPAPHTGATGATGGGGPAPTGPPIGWMTSAANQNLRGKNGQHFSYTCPPNGSTTGIYGTDIYTDDSAICVAAVHAGVISLQKGGAVTIEILPGQPSYAPSARNGITSLPWGGFYAGSYKFARDIVGLPQQVLPPAPAPSGGAAAGKLSMESNTNRRGQDYRNFDLAQPRPELCQSECAADAKCKAYTYVKPGLQGSKARCWLKSSIPNPQGDSCCVSGVKGSK